MIDIDGGEICAKCAGVCCNSCGECVGHYNKYNIYDHEVLNRIGIPMEVVNKLRWDNRNKIKNEEERKELIQLYSKKLGYYDPVKGFLGPMGCTIPREKRSQKCLTFHCEKLTEARQTQNP
jgi:hypothetical protein